MHNRAACIPGMAMLARNKCSLPTTNAHLVQAHAALSYTTMHTRCRCLTEEPVERPLKANFILDSEPKG